MSICCIILHVSTGTKSLGLDRTRAGRRQIESGANTSAETTSACRSGRESRMSSHGSEEEDANVAASSPRTARRLQERLAELEMKLARCVEENQKKDAELCQAYHQAEEAKLEAEKGKEEIQRLAYNLEHVRTQCELERHRKMEALREEHAEQLKYERKQWEREKDRADSWASELKSRFELEKGQLEQKIQSLESELVLERRKQRFGSPDRQWQTVGQIKFGGPDCNAHGAMGAVYPESMPRPRLAPGEFTSRPVRPNSPGNVSTDLLCNNDHGVRVDGASEQGSLTLGGANSHTIGVRQSYAQVEDMGAHCFDSANYRTDFGARSV